ncbi:MAG TPA: aspartyl protease family protein [Rhizomicrobium sp.]
MASGFSRRGFLATAASFAAVPLAHADPARLLTIPVTIAGNGPFQFVVDSGAERTVIADDIAATLGLTKSGRASVVGIVREMQADTVALPRLEAGGVVAQNLHLPVLPRTWLQADGYLGLDIIDGHRVTFDFARNKLELREPILGLFAGYARPDESVLSASGQSGKLRTADCRVDGIPAIAFLDTGAEVSVANSQLYKALAEQGAQFLSAAPMMLSGITGGSVPARTLSIGRAQLGGFDLSTTGLAVADLPIFDLWGLADKPALFVGMDFLRKFSRVSIDYGHGQYRLELASLMLASRAQS